MLTNSSKNLTELRISEQRDNVAAYCKRHWNMLCIANISPESEACLLHCVRTAVLTQLVAATAAAAAAP